MYDCLLSHEHCVRGNMEVYLYVDVDGDRSLERNYSKDLMLHLNFSIAKPWMSLAIVLCSLVVDCSDEESNSTFKRLKLPYWTWQLKLALQYIREG
jgi:hypothetical protein